MRKFALLFFFAALIGVQLLAQTRPLTGKITDETGSPLIGATVSVVASSRATTTTNALGVFTLAVPSNAKQLEVTYVGYVTQRVSVTSAGTMSVKMVPATGSLGDVVVTGYTREKKTQFAGAASAISTKAVEMTAQGSFDQALQGRAPGVLVNSGSGQPGSSPNIVIRGVQSLQGSSQPLYILDGIPMPAADFQTINPNDFESITVLKDAAAAALYGARAGTGVIVITTKKGKAGATNFTFSSQVGFTQAPNLNNFDLMSTREILQYEEFMGLAGSSNNVPGWIYSKRNPSYTTLPATSATPFAPSQARYDFMLDSIGNIDNNWQDIFFRRGLSQQYDISMRAGSEKTRVFMSAGVFNQEGTDLKSSLKRYTMRVNLDHTSNKFFTSLTSTAGYSQTGLSEGEWLGNSPRNPFQMAFRAKPYEIPFNPDGSFRFGANTTLNLRQVGNLLEGIENTTQIFNQVKLNAGLTVGYRLFPTLTIKNVLGTDIRSEYSRRFVNPNSYIGILQQFVDTSVTFNAGTNQEGYRLVSQFVNTTSLVYNERFADKHDVEVGGYFETVKGEQQGLGFQMWRLDPRLGATGQGSGALPTNGATTVPQYASSARSGFGIRSFFGTARYTYNNKYTLSAAARQDGTNRILKEDNRQIFTWSTGFTWNAMQEGFMKKQGLLSNLVVRLSYGVVPSINSIATGSYGFSGGQTAITNFLGPQLPTFGGTNYAGSGVAGLVPSNAGNPDLKIEMVHKTNIGVDFAMWKNRARFTVDIYKNKTVDLFVQNPLSSPTGFGGGTQIINAGVLSNKGIEATVNIDVVKSNDWDVTLGANHSININRIEDLGLVDEYQSGTFIIKKGLSFGTHYDENYLGADPATGRPVFETQNGGTTTDPGRAGFFHKWGSYLPKHVGGLTLDVRYKGFTMSALFSYQFDVTRSNNIEAWTTMGIPGYHTAVNGAQRLLTQQWRKPGDNAVYQNLLYDRGFVSTGLQDASFLRFRNLNVSYQIPGIGSKTTKYVKGARVYMQMQNVWITSPWRGPDPEDNNNISLNEFPNPRMTVFGIDINF